MSLLHIKLLLRPIPASGEKAYQNWMRLSITLQPFTIAPFANIFEGRRILAIWQTG